MDIQQKTINTMRKLGLNQVLQAKSGHTGIVLGCAPIMYAVYASANINPADPHWFNRDRIVLSAGHGSALLYSAMHLFGFLEIDDLRDFRQIGSKTTGHPEISTAGVDASTGALGQGFSNAVGLALAEKMLQKYNKPKFPLIDHYTYVIVGDGDLMEGISYESASFAGKNGLNKLIVLYDSNRISLDGKTSNALTEDTILRFQSAGFNVIEVKNGNDYIEILKAIQQAKQSDKPNLIICNTVIGFGSPFADSEKCHSNPFDNESANKVIADLGLNTEPFAVDNDVYEHCQTLINNKLNHYYTWQKLSSKYKSKFGLEWKEIHFDTKKAVSKLGKMDFKGELSTREIGHKVLNQIAKNLPALVGGSADLSKSTLAYIEDSGYFGSENLNGRNIAYGVREHAMAGISNGLALHGGLLPFCSTFTVFSDYMRYSIRMSAMMNLKNIFIFTHDSIAVGEDGTTHQPIEQIESLRLIPNLQVFRPADANEVIASYQFALQNEGTTVIVLSRQKLPQLENSSINSTTFGGYIVSPEKNKKELNGIIVATGSEVELAIQAQKAIEKDDLSIRVVSMPNRELFFAQEKKYREKVLPSRMTCRLVVEAGVTAGWYKVAGLDGFVLGIDSFGESGKPVDLYRKFGFTLPNIVKLMDKLIDKNKTKIDSII